MGSGLEMGRTWEGWGEGKVERYHFGEAWFKASQKDVSSGLDNCACKIVSLGVSCREGV